MKKNNEMYFTVKETENLFKQWLNDVRTDPQTIRETEEILHHLAKIWETDNEIEFEDKNGGIALLCSGFCIGLLLRNRNYH